MQQFLRSVLAQDESVTASTTVTYDLPVNPLSHILLTLRFANETSTITNYSVLAAALAQISNIEVLFKGSAIVSGSLTDLALLSSALHGKQLQQLNMTETDNDVRAVTVAIPFGRKLYSPLECFPAVRRGELQLRLTYAAAQTGIDTLTMQIETVELPEAAPTRFLKYTTISKTPSATGDHDVDLPIGNKVAMVQLFGTSVPTGASFNASFGVSKLLIDNIESYYAKANWETLHNELMQKIGNWRYYSHYHSVNAAGAGRENTLGQIEDASLIDNYALLDFDPLGDDSYLLNTEGRSRVHLRVTADVADAIRIIPVEVIELTAAA